MRYLLACLVFFLLVLNASPVLARGIDNMPEPTAGQINEALNNLTPVRFLPNNPLYLLIRFKEVISRLFQPSFRQRAEFDYKISSKRLKEAYLLSSQGDLKGARKKLASYVKCLDKIEGQLEKARSQNQDVTTLVEKFADNLKYQVVILTSLSNLKGQDQETLGVELEASLISFGDFILYLDKIKPGTQDRFKPFFEDDVEPKTSNLDAPTLLGSPSPSSEASGQAKPRRIIY